MRIMNKTKNTNLGAGFSTEKRRPQMLSYDESVQFLHATNPQQNATISNLKTSYSKCFESVTLSN